MRNITQINCKLCAIGFILFAINVSAQMQCAPGYEARQVKCRNSFTVQCLAANYTCKQCWILEFDPCPGRKMGGMQMADSFEKALKAARNESDNWKNGECLFYDNRNFKIYIEDVNLCFTPEAKEAVKTDLRNNIIAFLERFRQEIANYRRVARGRAPNLGATIREYENVFDNAQTHAQNLENRLASLTNHNLSEVERLFKDVQKEAESLRSIWANDSNSERVPATNTSGSSFYFFMTTSLNRGQTFEKPTDVISAPIEYTGSIDDDLTRFKSLFIQQLNQQLPASTGVRNLIPGLRADQITIVMTKPYSTTLLHSTYECQEAINAYIQKVKKDNDIFPELTPNFYKLK